MIQSKRLLYHVTNSLQASFGAQGLGEGGRGKHPSPSASNNSFQEYSTEKLNLDFSLCIRFSWNFGTNANIYFVWLGGALSEKRNCAWVTRSIFELTDAMFEWEEVSYVPFCHFLTIYSDQTIFGVLFMWDSSGFILWFERVISWSLRLIWTC